MNMDKIATSHTHTYTHTHTHHIHTHTHSHTRTHAPIHTVLVGRMWHQPIFIFQANLNFRIISRKCKGTKSDMYGLLLVDFRLIQHKKEQGRNWYLRTILGTLFPIWDLFGLCKNVPFRPSLWTSIGPLKGIKLSLFKIQIRWYT